LRSCSPSESPHGVLTPSRPPRRRPGRSPSVGWLPLLCSAPFSCQPPVFGLREWFSATLRLPISIDERISLTSEYQPVSMPPK
jgi:hypothetical protein